MPASWQWPGEMIGDRVYDVSGRRIGLVTAFHAETSQIDVQLTPRMARRLGASSIVHVPMADVIDADDHDVTLRDEAEFEVHPERRPAPAV